MIAFLEGELLDIGPGRVVLNVAGVGYELAVPTSLLAALPPRGAAPGSTRAWSCARTR